MSETFVYIITPADAPTPCKVGISNNPWSRLLSLQTGSPAKLKVAEVYSFDNREEAAAMERQFHILYADWRLHGEWFDVDFDDANYFLFENTVAEEVWGL